MLRSPEVCEAIEGRITWIGGGGKAVAVLRFFTKEFSTFMESGLRETLEIKV